MKPSAFDLKELSRQDTRLRAFKERNFDEHGYDNWIIPVLITAFTFTVIITIMFSIAFYYFSN